MTYNPESYWSRVGEEIEKRAGDNVIAGDDNPYHAYKRSKFLRRFLDTIDFQSKAIMEVGFGPGGNLRHIATRHHPHLILGADISQKMYDIAQRNLHSFGNVKLAKIDGTHLPFDDQSVDLSFTVTVLQHVTDATILKTLIQDICRVTRDTVIIMEDIGRHEQLGGEGSGVNRTVGVCLNRTVGVYQSLLAEHGFQLRKTQFLNTRVSRRWYEFAWRVYLRVLARDHHEGDRINALGKLSIALPLIVTRVLDNVLTEDGNLAKLTFGRSDNAKPERAPLPLHRIQSK
jgi:SAM-dependent methyltransferase